MTVAPPLPPPGPLQNVYLSARPRDVARSLASFRQHHKTARAIIAAPDRLAHQMRSVLNEAGVAGAVLTDEEVLPGAGRIADHALRNYKLRYALYSHSVVDPFFIALDDDCILLRPLPRDHFLDTGRLVGRYSHASMTRWKCSGFAPPRSYDLAQWNSAKLLTSQGIPDLGYGAHQAQIICKADVCAIAAAIAGRMIEPVDEWSLYFNSALAKWPDRYVARKTTTLFWPGMYGSWMPDWFDQEVWFENRYEQFYESGGPAHNAGLREDSDWRLKRDFCAAGYASNRTQQMLNELNAGEPLTLFAGNGAALPQLNAAEVFGLPGPVLRIAVETGEAKSVRAGYVVSRDGQVVAQCASPVQTVGAMSDLNVRMPPAPGQYDLALRVTSGSSERHLCVPLFVLPVPVSGNS